MGFILFLLRVKIAYLISQYHLQIVFCRICFLNHSKSDKVIYLRLGFLFCLLNKIVSINSTL